MLSNNSEINNILNNINMLHADDSNDNHNNMTKKGRGRPRKEIITEYQVQPISEPKKRGRKPKENKPIINKTITKNEEIVLHLPNINSADLIKHGIFMQNTKNTTSESNDNINNSNINNIDNNNNNIFTICDSDSDDSSSFNEERTELLSKIKSMTDQISQLENKLNDCNNSSTSSKFIIDRHNVTKMNINLIDFVSGQTVILDHVDIACWWCTEPFTTLPCFIVRDIKNGAYVVFGCFCSFNCAVKFNLQMDDYNFKIWDRYSLTKQFYNEITLTTDNIPEAPPREVLKKYGGYLTIEDFRKNSKIITKEYRCILPPMIAVVPFIEENNKTAKRNTNDFNLHKNDEIILKRTKPLPNSKNNLANAFNFHKKN